MVRVVFMCGPAGSGKSTVARALEGEGLVRLSFDHEGWSRGLRSMPLKASDHASVEEHLRRRVVELVVEGRDVVLDFSFWSRRMRQDWRDLLKPLGVVPETIYMATDRGTCLERVRARSLGHSDDFMLDPVVAASYWDRFQVPTPDEGPLTVLP